MTPKQPSVGVGLPAATLGQAVQRLRTERGLSLRTLAGKAGFSPSFVSQVENGQTSPSISSLERLARALGFGIADFFGRMRVESALVMRNQERQRLTSEWSRAHIEPLVPPESLQSLAGVLITLRPGGRSGKEAVARPWEQLALVLRGKVVLTVNGVTHLMGEGDAAAIPSDCHHAWRNEGAFEARLVIVSARRHA